MSPAAVAKYRTPVFLRRDAPPKPALRKVRAGGECARVLEVGARCVRCRDLGVPEAHRAVPRAGPRLGVYHRED
eukprot:10113535-Alexandrium_andersonii.AAC.1